jgi:hypothetical protein
MTTEELQEAIYNWTESHKKGIATVCAIIGIICFMLEACNVIQ